MQNTTHNPATPTKTAPHPDLHAARDPGADWPAWWNSEISTGWDRAKEAMRRDWQQTKHDFDKKRGRDLGQGMGDTVSQAAGKSAIPARGVANPPEPMDFDMAEPALRYGFAAATHYHAHAVWNDALEAKLHKEWTDQKPLAQPDVKRGWESARGAQGSSHHSGGTI